MIYPYTRVFWSCSVLQYVAVLCISSKGTSKAWPGAQLHYYTLQYKLGASVWHAYSTVAYTLPLATLQHTATNCNTLQHAATRCNTLHHTAPHCNTLQHTATQIWCISSVRLSSRCTNTSSCNTLQHTATHCNTLQHTTAHFHANLGHQFGLPIQLVHKHFLLQYSATRCNTLQHAATHYNKLQHEAGACLAGLLNWCANNSSCDIATHCNTLQHIAAHCNTLQHTAPPCNTHHINLVHQFGAPTQLVHKHFLLRQKLRNWQPPSHTFSCPLLTVSPLEQSQMSAL